MADDRLKKITDVLNTLSKQARGPKGSLIVNGGFEDPVVRQGGYVTYRPGQAFTGWQVIGPSGGVSPISGSYTHSGTRFVAREGQQWLDLTGPSASTGVGVQQTVNTTPGKVYDLAFWVGNVSAGGFGTTSTVEVFVDGQSLGLAHNEQTIPGQQGWGLFKMQVTATGNTTTLAFLNRDPSNDNSNGLDAVSLVRAQTAQASAGPEPADAPSAVAAPAPAPATAPAAAAPDAVAVQDVVQRYLASANREAELNRESVEGSQTVVADLDGDGKAEIALLTTLLGGTYWNYSVTVFTDRGKGHVVAASTDTPLGMVDSIAVKDGSIHVTAKWPAPNDPRCCPSLQRTTAYAWQGNKLVETRP